MILNNERTNRCKDFFHKAILKELANYDVWVAGGAIRSWYTLEKIVDIDLFFPSESERDKALRFLKGKKAKVIFENENVTKVRYKKYTLDLCKKYFPGPQETIDDFDFTVSMGAVDKEDSYFGPDFFMDLASRRLAFNKVPYPMSSLSRLQKYIKRGYWICKEEMVNFTKVLQGVDLTLPDNQPLFEEEGAPQSGSGNEFAGMD